MPVSSSSMPRTAQLSAAKRKVERLREHTRSRSLSPDETESTQKAVKDAQKEQEKLQYRLQVKWLFLTLILVSVILAIARAFPVKMSPASLLWLLEIPATSAEKTADFLTVLTPFLAIAVAIERLLETGFNWFEQTSRAVADILVAPQETLDWVGREYQDAYDAADEAVATVGIQTTPESMELLDRAEERLTKAEERLRSWTQAPEYIAWKKALSIWLGLLAGLVIAILGDLGMLRYIGIATPRLIDMIVTGLVIGAGPGPMHDMIGILQNSRNALGSLTDLAKGKSMRDAAALIREAQQQIKQEEESL